MPTKTFYDSEADEGIVLGRCFDRYSYDGYLLPKGWRQYDTFQDASYFGVWVNTELKQIFTYAEGDRSLVVCDNEDEFKAELKKLAEFYGDPPPAFITLDDYGIATYHYDTRPE